MNLDKIEEEKDSDKGDSWTRPVSASLKDAKKQIHEEQKNKDSEEAREGRKEKKFQKQFYARQIKEEREERKKNEQDNKASLSQPPPPPPPPAVPKGGGDSLGLMPRIQFNPKDLKMERKKLKRPNEIVKQVDVDRLQVFDKFKKYSHMPLVDSREYLRTLKAEIKSISFNGVEQMTDTFLFSLHHCKLDLSLLSWISLVGCYNVTDEGIYWICKAMKNMTSIQLLGCNRVTERSMFYIRTMLPNCTNMYMDATSCGLVPVNCLAKLGDYTTTSKAVTGKPQVYVNGCPLISPLPTDGMDTNSAGVLSPYRKLVILTPEGLPWSPLALLLGDRDQALKPGLVYKQSWRPFKDHKITGVKSSAEIFNVFQVPNAKGLPELILSPGSLVILPYHLQPKTSSDNTARSLATQINSVLTKHDDCTFVLLAMSGDGDSTDYTKKRGDVAKKVKNYIETWLNRLQAAIKMSIDTNWRMAALNHHEQEVLGNSERLLRHSKLFDQENSSTKCPLVSAHLQVGESQPLPIQVTDLQFLKEAVEADEENFGWNRQAFYSDKVMTYSAGLSKASLPVQSLRAVSSKHKLKGLPPHNTLPHMAKLMSYTALWGHSIYYPVVEDKPVISDMRFLATVLEKIFFKSAPRKCNIGCLGDNIPCWTAADLISVGQGVSQEQMKLLIRVFEKHGCLLRFPVDPWSNFTEDSSVYVLYSDIPVSSIEAIGEFWEETDMQTIQKDKYFFFSPGMPQSFFPNILRHALKLGSPGLVWKNGIVVQKGYLKILLEKAYDCQGLPVLLVQVRYPRPAESAAKDTEQSAWTTLKLYSTMVDHMVLKYKLAVAKAVACIKCLPSNSRYKILADKDYRRFFLEHLVRSGEHFDVSCKTCDATTHSQVQLGKAIELSDLVPQHKFLLFKERLFNWRGKLVKGIEEDQTDAKSKDPPDPIAKKQEGEDGEEDGEKKDGFKLRTLPFNRCLMCENCAIEGLDCKVNLTQGTRSWYCGCNRSTDSCLACGMCLNCYLYLKRIVASVQPLFEPPKSERFQQDQMLALDEVKVSEKGSIVGFIASDTKLELDSCMLSPGYIPRINLTILKEGHMTVIVRISCPELQLIRYESSEGSVFINNKEVRGKDASRVLNNGQTISILSTFETMTDIDSMRISLILEGTEIYSHSIVTQLALVSLDHVTEGLFVQVETPTKFRAKNMIRGQVGGCGFAVMNLPCAIEARLWRLQKNVEEVCFGGRGISLSGSAVIALPTPLSMDTLKRPRLDLFAKINYHHLCLTWNPFSGKKLHTVQNIPIGQNPEFWKLKKLVHLIDSEGLKASQGSKIDREASFMLWAWHQIFASFPEILLPATLNHLFPPGVYTKETEVQVKEGLRQLGRMGKWLYLTKSGVCALEQLFKAMGQGRQSYKGEVLTTKNKIVSSALTLVELQNEIKGPKLNETYSRFNQNLALYLCDGHTTCMKMKEGLTEIPAELYGTYSVFLSFIDLGSNEITSIPSEFFENLPNLVDLNMGDNFISEIPASIRTCKKLHALSMPENDLEDLPEAMAYLEQLTVLNMSCNRFQKVPHVITKLTLLTQLELNNMMLTALPEEIGNLVQLKTLYLNGNCLTKLPASFTKLQNLESLGLNGVQWMTVKASGVVTYNQFRSFLMTSKMDRYLESNSEDKDEIFRMFDENSNGVLDLKEVGKLNAVIFNLFPRFGLKGKDEPPDEAPAVGFPMELLSCKSLRILHLTYHGFTKVPPEISQLQNLVTLTVSHNPYLISIPAELSLIEGLRKIELDDCPSLKTPPREIREKGFQSTFAYLQRLMSGAVHSKRTKLMLVGLGGAGKTSLVKALLSKQGKADLQHGEEITDGIDIKAWTVEHKGDKITYNIWDFAGQTVYYNTHQFFLSTNRAVYMLLWNVRLGHEHAGLDFWLSSISVQAPDTPIFVVGSHIDQVNKTELPLEEMKQRYPQIVGFHFISNFTGTGIAQLKEDLFNVTLQQQYMGENIPAVWLTFEKNIELVKSSENIIMYEAMEKIANRSGIFEKSEIFQAIQFLHDLGSVQHFTNEYLKSKVVINPQWIVDVMACVVSVKNKVIQNGRLSHKDLGEIWEKYPKKLHSWLLRLTEEFDLTFALNNEEVNLVPCLMTEKKPEFTWEEVDKDSDIKENKMVYKFEYLPAGLFNRGQVRLHNLSDSALIWKKGSFLRKNVHVALLQQTRDRELVVTVQGPRPENILFLVHEVFEGLIAESYNGVKYDFSMPCPDCQKMNVKDCHMFEASTIRRALDMKAPFLQCIKYFHTISCSDLQTMLPPDTHSDFDAHLVYCVQGLKNLRQDLSTDIFMSFCAEDALLDKNVYITPAKVHADLVNKGYKCWYKEPSEIQSTDEMAKALIDSSVLLAFVSNNYARNEECINIFKYARLTLKKSIVVVALGDNFDWKQSKLGILLADEVFVNMIKPKLQFYESKFEELLKSLSGKTRIVSEVPTAKPAVFISYTWINSAQAVALGTREVPGALGYGDPRELKDYLEKYDISCWLDVERVGMNGLFDDIAEGLLSAKVVIVCVSDEYAASPTCQIEFRYAANTLKLPIIIVVVGTGDSWRATEVGLMSVKYPIVNLQDKNKKGKQKLRSLVEDCLSQGDDVDGAVTAKRSETPNENNKNLSYHELFELAQRKLLRQLSFYVENHDVDVYPRLFVLDFASEEQIKQEMMKAADHKNIPNKKGKSEDDEERGEEEEEEEKREEEEEEKRDDVAKEGLGSRKSDLSRHSSNMLPAYKLERFCVYTLCEHDEGWHSVADPILLPESFGMTELDKYSPYISRITTVMKYNKELILNCLTEDIGQDYVKWLEKSPEATMSDYQSVYHMFREMIIEADPKKTMGNLRRCHLSNGKTIWLCKDHISSMKVTTLSSDDKSATSYSKEHDKHVNDSMLVGLKTMDFTSVSGFFKSSGNAPRTRIPNRFSSHKSGKKPFSKKRPDRKKKSSADDDQENENKTQPPSSKTEPPQPVSDKAVPETSATPKQDKPDAAKPHPTNHPMTDAKDNTKMYKTTDARYGPKKHSHDYKRVSGRTETSTEAGSKDAGKQVPREMPIPKPPTRQESRDAMGGQSGSQGTLGRFPGGASRTPSARYTKKSGQQTSRACNVS